MLKSVSVGTIGSEGIITYFDGRQNGNIIITKIDGMDAGKATINTFKNSFGPGSRYSSSKVNERNIVFSTAFPVGTEVQVARRQQYEICPLGNRVRVTVESSDPTTGSDIRIIDGYVESNTTDVFSNLVKGQISIICPDPYFKKQSPSGDTFYEDIDSEEETLVQPTEYDGSAEGGYTLNLTANGTSGSYLSGEDISATLMHPGATEPETIFTLPIPSELPEVTDIAGQVYTIKDQETYSISDDAPNGLIANISDWRSQTFFKDASGTEWGQIVPGNAASGPYGELTVIFDLLPVTLLQTYRYEFDFVSNGITFHGFEVEYTLHASDNTHYRHVKYLDGDDFPLSELFVYSQNPIEEIDGTWLDEAYRTIKIIGGEQSEIERFLNNTKDYAIIYGTTTKSSNTLLKVNYLTNDTNKRWNFRLQPFSDLSEFELIGSFTSNSTQYDKMKLTSAGSTSSTHKELHYISNSGIDTLVYSYTSTATQTVFSWTDQKYRLITTQNQDIGDLKYILNNGQYTLSNTIYVPEYSQLMPNDKIVLKTQFASFSSGSEELINNWLNLVAFDGGASLALDGASNIEVTVKNDSVQITSEGKFLSPYNKSLGIAPKIKNNGDTFEISGPIHYRLTPNHALEYQVLYSGGI